MIRDQGQIIVTISCLVPLERYWAVEHDDSYSIHVTFKKNDYRNKNKYCNQSECSKAGINSLVTVPSKLRASQDSTKTKVTCSCKHVYRVVCLGSRLASSPLPKKVLFVNNWSEHSACSTSLDENTVGLSIWHYFSILRGPCFLTVFNTNRTEQDKTFLSFSDKPLAKQDDMGGHGVTMKVRQVKGHSDLWTGIPNPPFTT